MQPVLNANVYGVSTDLPYWELCKNAVEFVYFIQVYRFRGTDITVWRQLSDGRFDQFVAATGPVMLGPVVHQSQSLPPQSGGEMSSEDRVLWRLREFSWWSRSSQGSCCDPHQGREELPFADHSGGARHQRWTSSWSQDSRALG